MGSREDVPGPKPTMLPPRRAATRVQPAPRGDRGRHDARSICLYSRGRLSRVMAIVGERGFGVVNVDFVGITERPKVGPFVGAMRDKLSEVRGVASMDVSGKGKTNEGLGEIGRGEALAAQAVALLKCV